ncbi:MAG: Cof-type HAD-IIB family hydrolase [Oscillospiraceae bacterium]|nr:Cof-type HAD-IIB family hydrolase [Oscillospiraceae bacterium]
MSVKLIAFDMDGTLLDEDHVTIPQENVSALRSARKRGVKIVAATGRTWCLVHPAVGPLDGVDYAVISNGAAVLEPGSGRWLYTKPIPNDKALELLAFLKSRGLPFEVYCEGQNFMEKGCVALMPETLLSDSFTKFYDQFVTYVDSLEEALAGRPMEKVDIFYVPPEHRAEVSRGIRAILPTQLAHAVDDNMEVTAADVTKGAALQKLCGELGISADEVMAFGDGNNDVEMLQWAGLSFAMENGSEDAKAAAKQIAPANFLGGVGQMVRKYILEEE